MRQDYIELSASRTLLLGLGCAVLGALSFSDPVAFADGDRATSDVLSNGLILPYDARLQIDSEGANGNLRMRFELFEAPSGGTAQWTEEQAVSLYDGNLSVGLGAVTPLTQTLLDAQKLWLGITVLEDDGQGGIVELALSGRQAIAPAPFSMWSAHAADLAVAGKLDVAGDMITDRDVRVAGDVTAHSGQVHLGRGNAAGLGDGGHALSHDLATGGLTLNPGGSFAGGVRLEGGVTIGSAMTIAGDTALGGPAAQVVSPGRTTPDGALVLNRDLATFGAGEVDNVHTLRGTSGLEVGATGRTHGFFEVDALGNVVVTGNLEVTGTYVLGPAGPESSQQNDGGIDLGVPVSEGFCFLTRFEADPTPSPNQVTGCRIGKGLNWSLNTLSSSTTCKARCIRF